LVLKQKFAFFFILRAQYFVHFITEGPLLTEIEFGNLFALLALYYRSRNVYLAKIQRKEVPHPFLHEP